MLSAHDPGSNIVRNTVADRFSVLLFEHEKAIGEALASEIGENHLSVVYAKDSQHAISLLSSITLDALVVPVAAHRNNGSMLWEEMASILPKTTALYVTSNSNESKPTGHLAAKVRSILEPPFSAKVLAADFEAFLEERRSSPEKRKWDRIPVLMDVKLTFENDVRLDAVALNVGLGGFFVALPTNVRLPALGEHVAFEFNVPGVKTLKGVSVVQWSQEAPLGRSSPQARGMGCEFFQPESSLMETTCRMINALTARHVPQEFRSRMKAKDLATKAVRLLSWLGSHKIELKDGARTSERECVCFEPLLTLNLTGFLLGFCESQARNDKPVYLDFVGSDHAAEFKVEIGDQAITPDTIASLKASMPALFAAAGGRDSLHTHHINLDFVLSAGTLAIVFRFPTRGPKE